MNQVTEFENARWSKGPQSLVFRHSAALSFINPDDRVLDVACGDGLFLSMALEKGAIVTGADISDQALENARSRGLKNLVKCDVTTENLPFKDGEFEVCSALDVLEHVLEPERVLKELARVGKRVVVSVPNFSSLPSRLQCLLGKVPENNRPNKGHVYWFNRSVLEKLLRDSGLVIFEMKQNYQGMGQPIIGPIIRSLSWAFPNLFALSFVVVAQKSASDL